MTGSGTFYHRAGHELIARTIAEKHRRQFDRTRIEDGYRVMGKGTGRG